MWRFIPSSPGSKPSASPTSWGRCSTARLSSRLKSTASIAASWSRELPANRTTIAAPTRRATASSRRATASILGLPILEPAGPRDTSGTGSQSFLFSPDHLAAVGLTAALCVGLPVAARARPGAWARLVARGLAVLLIATVLAYHLVVALRGDYALDFDLPLHLTDAVGVVAALALWSLRPLAFELTYFWGLTASLAAVLTPALGADDGHPSLLFWHYFVTHSGVVVAAVLLAFGLGLTARRGAVRRVFGVTVAWAALAGVGNALTGGNYMFLAERPQTPSPLDYLGPWPWYILSAALLALVLFALLDLPFRRRRVR
ncbi:MAG: TIGR02206 family membrane protein [Solirubrobacterales bacterium]|nr:TIGR02206 family membrane protein [Solirubrobacterales bacterium]